MSFKAAEEKILQMDVIADELSKLREVLKALKKKKRSPEKKALEQVCADGALLTTAGNLLQDQAAVMNSKLGPRKKVSVDKLRKMFKEKKETIKQSNHSR